MQLSVQASQRRGDQLFCHWCCIHSNLFQGLNSCQFYSKTSILHNTSDSIASNRCIACSASSMLPRSSTAPMPSMSQLYTFEHKSRCFGSSVPPSLIFPTFASFPICASSTKSRVKCHSEMHQLHHQFRHVCPGYLCSATFVDHFSNTVLEGKSAHPKACSSNTVLILGGSSCARSPATSPGNSSRPGLGSSGTPAASRRRCASS